MAAMIPLLDVIAHFERAALETKFAVDRETRLLMESVAVEARNMIGSEDNGWAPLAPATIKEKTRLGFGGQKSATDPLLRSGQLENSISAEAESTADGAEGVVGSTDPVSVFQEMGTRHIPARPFLGGAMTKVEPAAEVAFGELAMRALTPGSRL